MVHVKKVIQALEDNTFWVKLAQKMMGEQVLAGNNIYRVENRAIVNEIHQEDVYQKYFTQYKSLIDQFQIESRSDPSNIVWICWLQGIENAPLLVKACINSVKHHLKDKDIRIVCENNLEDYITFPEYIVEKYKKGIISKTHYSDLIRTELLCRYGGLWCDATVLCTSSDIPESIRRSELFVFQPLNLDRSAVMPIVASSWLIKASKNNRIMLLTRELLYKYWETENHLADYFLFHLFFAMAVRKYHEDWEKVPVFNNQSPHVLQFEFNNDYSEDRWNDIKKMSCFHKLNHHIIYDNPNGYYTHILKQYGTDICGDIQK